MVIFYYNMVFMMSFETIFHYFIHIIQLCNSPEEKICMSKFYKIPKSMS